MKEVYRDHYQASYVSAKYYDEWKSKVIEAPSNAETVKMMDERRKNTREVLFGINLALDAGIELFGGALLSGTGSYYTSYGRSWSMNAADNGNNVVTYKVLINGLSKTVSSQKQLRHLAGTPENVKNGGGFMNSVSDAQSVLDAVHTGKATFLGTNKAGFPVFLFKGVTGTNVNVGAGITGQSTNVFIIKGTTSLSVVPTNPFW